MADTGSDSDYTPNTTITFGTSDLPPLPPVVRTPFSVNETPLLSQEEQKTAAILRMDRNLAKLIEFLDKLAIPSWLTKSR